MTELDVVIVSDFLCPWCFVGYAGLKSLATAWSDKYKLRIEMGTYYLNKDLKRDTGVLLKEHFKKKGRTDEEIAAALSSSSSLKSSSTLDQLAADADIYFPKGVDKSNWRIYNSGRAHLLQKYAMSKAQKQLEAENLILDIYRAYHFENKNIDNEEVLIKLATKHGFLDIDEIRRAIDNEEELQKSYREFEKNKEREVGVPQYYFYKNGKLVHHISGAQEIRTLLKGMRTAAEADA